MGKKAAMATPIWALAAAMFRSAAAMSGRRSRSCDGTPAGMDGTFWAQRRLGNGKRRGRFAYQGGDGVLQLGPLHPQVDGLWPGCS